MPGKENPFRRILDFSSQQESDAERQRLREKEERESRERMELSLANLRRTTEVNHQREQRKKLEKDPRYEKIMEMANHPFLQEALQDFYNNFTDKEKFPLDKRVGFSLRPNAKELTIIDRLQLTDAGEIQGALTLWVPGGKGEKGCGIHVSFEWINKPIRPEFVAAEPRPTNHRVELIGNDLTYIDHFEGRYREPGIAIETVYKVDGYYESSDYDSVGELYTYPIHALPPTSQLDYGNIYESKRRVPDNTLIFQDATSFKTWHDMFIRSNMDDVLKELGALFLRLQKSPTVGYRYD